jgi:hypothetical protein
MEIVKDKILYHFNAKTTINKFDLLNEGDTFETENFNPFRDSYEHYCGDFKKGLYDSAVAYWRFTKEYIFEEVRQQVNRDLPSRWESIWLTEEDYIEYWRQWYKKSEYKILKLKVTGKVFIGDAHWVETNGPVPLQRVRRDAFHYWNGDFFRLPGKEEILFNGKAEVLEVLEHNTATSI